MNRIVPVFIFFLCIAFSARLFAFANMHTDAPFFSHTVKKNESVSLICLDYYGNYSLAMGMVIAKENPGVKDINVIFTGQILKLHNPDYKPKKQKDIIPLFEKKVNATQGVVTYVEGDVVLIPQANPAKKQNLIANTIVYPGDIIQTGIKGRVEIIINKETVVRIRENTKLTVDAFRDNASNAGRTRMAFSVGSVWAKMKKFRDKVSRFELELPTAIAGVHGTVYQAMVEKDSSTEVKVYTGEVAVKNNPAMTQSSQQDDADEVSGPSEESGPSEVTLEEWVSIVNDMQKIKIDKKGNPRSVEDFKTNDADSWESWNLERDKRIESLFGETE